MVAAMAQSFFLNTKNTVFSVTCGACNKVLLGDRSIHTVLSKAKSFALLLAVTVCMGRDRSPFSSYTLLTTRLIVVIVVVFIGERQRLVGLAAISPQIANIINTLKRRGRSVFSVCPKTKTYPLAAIRNH